MFPTLSNASPNSIFASPDPAEDFVELGSRHRERKMLSALGAPLGDLQREIRSDAQRGERLAVALVL
jgi:hypothetical protein